MRLPQNDTFQDVCSDVVVRFKGHGSYKGRSGALRAFKKRAPNFEPNEYEIAFDRFCAVYDLAVSAIQQFPSERESKSKYAKFEDIDFEKCLCYIDHVLPGYGATMKKQILGWVIFWHYLK